MGLVEVEFLFLFWFLGSRYDGLCGVGLGWLFCAWFKGVWSLTGTEDCVWDFWKFAGEFSCVEVVRCDREGVFFGGRGVPSF